MFLSDIRTLDPPYCLPQEECLNWMASAYAHYQKKQRFTVSDYQKILRRVGCYSTQIQKRFFFLPDFISPKIQAGSGNRIFDYENFGGTEARQTFFQEVALEVFARLYEERSVPPYLIHVTCTGYGAPSAAQILAARKSPETVVTHCYHMGCYGAFPAIRMAMGFLTAPALKMTKNVSVDIVHTELCTLHMSPRDPTPEQMIIQSLFADGIAAYSISVSEPNEPSLEILACEEFLVPQSESTMKWSIGNHGMTMTLSKDIPSIIGSFLNVAFQKWEKKRGESILQSSKSAPFVIHPGGPKILDSVKERLRLSEEQMRFSREVLRERGNVSSATVPHIWKKILECDEIRDGEHIVSMAFGPGITLCLSLMRVRK